jgi:hypothetical protein
MQTTGESVQVVSCYEAGYDGFWLHRFLEARGIINHVLEAASLLVNRKARRAMGGNSGGSYRIGTWHERRI